MKLQVLNLCSTEYSPGPGLDSISPDKISSMLHTECENEWPVVVLDLEYNQRNLTRPSDCQCFLLNLVCCLSVF